MKIKINNKYYNFFDNITINYKLDSVGSLFSFKARFNPDNEDHKEVFRPLQFQTVKIYDDNDNLKLTGNIISTSLNSQSLNELQSVSGYSTAGMLEDCTIPYGSYPLEKNNLSLNDIASSLLSPFGLSFVVDDSISNEMDLIYPKVVAEASETVKGFISKLASQRNIMIGHNEIGNLVFFKINANTKPKLYLNSENTVKMSLAVNGQAMHSDISVIRQPSKDNNGCSIVDSITNPLIGVNRSIVKVLSSGEDLDTKKAADNVLAAELKNISLIVSLHKIEDIKCGDFVDILNKEVFIYSRTKFIVSEITINQTTTSETMELKLLIPESFTGGVVNNTLFK